MDCKPADIEFCTCPDCKSVSSQSNDFGYWYVCNNCNKPIDETFVYFNHFDGEDHPDTLS